MSMCRGAVKRHGAARESSHTTNSFAAVQVAMIRSVFRTSEIDRRSSVPIGAPRR